MKTLLTIGLAAALLGFTARAQTLPSFTTETATGTTTAMVYFATSPLQQARIVGAVATSDLASANIEIRTGTTPLSCAYTNPAGNQFGVAATNGFVIGDKVLIETKAGVLTNGIITAFTKATNIICAGLTMPATVPGDQIYRLGSATLLPVGVATVNYQGEALFVGQKGRPVMVFVNGTSNCSLSSVTARYE